MCTDESDSPHAFPAMPVFQCSVCFVECSGQDNGPAGTIVRRDSEWPDKVQLEVAVWLRIYPIADASPADCHLQEFLNTYQYTTDLESVIPVTENIVSQATNFRLTTKQDTESYITGQQCS